MTEEEKATLFFTEAGLKTITQAIQTGAKSVYYGDKRVEFQDFNELVRIRNMILVALGLSKPNAGRAYGEFHKGIHRGFGAASDGVEGSECPWWDRF